MASEVSVQEAMAVHSEDTPAGDLNKTTDACRGLGSVTCELASLPSTVPRQPPS